MKVSLQEADEQRGYVAQLEAELAAAREERDRLRTFAAEVLRRSAWEGCDLDGVDAQELAFEHGIIVPSATREDWFDLSWDAALATDQKDPV